MNFVFVGFKQKDSIRHLSFQGIGDDHSRTDFVVQADISMFRRYSGTLQELPLLCRRLLEETSPTEETGSVIFTEEAMQLYAGQIASRAAATQKSRKMRRDAALPVQP